MIVGATARVRAGEELGRSEMRSLVLAIVDGKETDEDVADLLVALHARGESVDEVVGAAQALRERALPLPPAPEGAIDTCGTGGDRSGTFNISTLAALVVAGCGVPVAKHGNRSATSRCGSADVLEALGVRLDVPPARMAEAVKRIGIGFLFARACHPAMARVAPIRARIATPTLFNRLGPLTNPMRVRRQLVGVSDPGLVEPTLCALAELGCTAAWVVCARDGLDELSPCDASDVTALREGRRERFVVEAGRHVPRCDPTALRGGDPADNARIALAVLGGEPGPARDAVLLNAAAALSVAGRTPPGASWEAGLDAGVAAAAEALDSGRARELLARWVAFCEAGEAVA